MSIHTHGARATRGLHIVEQRCRTCTWLVGGPRPSRRTFPHSAGPACSDPSSVGRDRLVVGHAEERRSDPARQSDRSPARSPSLTEPRSRSTGSPLARPRGRAATTVSESESPDASPGGTTSPRKPRCPRGSPSGPSGRCSSRRPPGRAPTCGSDGGGRRGRPSAKGVRGMRGDAVPVEERAVTVERRPRVHRASLRACGQPP